MVFFRTHYCDINMFCTFSIFNRWLIFTTLFVSEELRLLFCQLKDEEKLITNVVVAFYKKNTVNSGKLLMHLMHPVVFSDMQFGNYIKALHGIGKYWKKMIERFIFTTDFSTRKVLLTPARKSILI